MNELLLTQEHRAQDFDLPGKMSDDYIIQRNSSNHSAYASEGEWGMMEMNEPLDLGSWFDTEQESTATAAPVAAAASSRKAKPPIFHGPSSRRAVKKKPGTPRRPLSSYNLFFAKERVRLYETSDSRISFAELGRTIGSRWKTLSKEDRREYEELAAKEFVRYRREKDAYDEMVRKELNERKKSNVDAFPIMQDTTTPPSTWQQPEVAHQMSNAEKNPAGGSGRPSYYFQPHDPEGPPPYASLPPGMLVSLRDPDGREQSYMIEYKCCRMTRKEAEAYMHRLTEQIETRQYG